MAESKSRAIANKPSRIKTIAETMPSTDYDARRIIAQVQNSLSGITSALAGYSVQMSNGGRALNNIRNLDLLDNNLRMQFITAHPIRLSQVFTQYPEVRRYIQQPNRDAMRGSLGSEIKLKFYTVDNTAIKEEKEDQGTPSQKIKRSPLDKMLSFATFGRYGNPDKQVFNSADDNKNSDKKSKETEEINLGDKVKLDQYEDFKAAQEANKKLAESTGRLTSERGLRRLSAYEERLILEKMDEEADLETIKVALDWKDLFGGAGIIASTIGSPDTYLNPSKIKKGDPLTFLTANNWQLAGVDARNINAESVLPDWNSDEPFQYGDITLHKSRVLTLKGDPMPYPFAGYARGWGMSRLEPVIAALNKRIKSDNVVYECLDEAKIDILQINGFDDIRFDTQGEELIKKKGEIISFMKNYLNMIMLDKEDDYKSKQFTFSGLPEIMNQSRIDLTGAFGMPETKVWGFMSAGFNSGGSDIKSYHEFVESNYRPPVKRILKWMAKLRARQVLGMDVFVEVVLPALDTATPLEQAKINTMLLDTIGKFSPAGNGILTSPQVYDILNELALLPVDFDTRQEIVPNPQAGNMFVRNAG